MVEQRAFRLNLKALILKMKETRWSRVQIPVGPLNEFLSSIKQKRKSCTLH